MLQELSARLSKILEQKSLKQKIEQDLRAVEAELQEKSARFAELGVQLAKENVDVKKLEQMSLTALFYQVLGSREEQLERERQELLSAQLRYGQTKKQLEFLEEERRSLVQRLEQLAGVESEYESLLAEKERVLRQSDQAVTKDLIAFSEQMADLNTELREITEAIAAGKDVIAGLEQVSESLESAGNWGLWDMFGGGLLSTAIKHSRIDEARSGVDAIQAKMSQFKRELSDVQKHVDLQIDIDGFAYFADFFFDGLIADWVVQSRIEDSLRQSKQAKEQIAQTVRELEELQTSTQTKIREVQEGRERLIART
jgi:DNA repair exonuclease SbcCD ATPase subunit